MMKWQYEKSERDRRHVYTFTFDDSDVSQMPVLSEFDQSALRHFSQQGDAEAKLMGLQILARGMAPLPTAAKEKP